MPGIRSRRRLTEISSGFNQPRIYHAYLAEEYDGIGQYAKIQLSRTSTSAGFMARVAAGDFGLGNKFPSGTPVTVFISRGQAEILTLGAK